MPSAVKTPIPLYYDQYGNALDNGYLYFGAVNQNPETSPIPIYYDALGTQPAENPVRTLGGVPIRPPGTPTNIYTNTNFSLTVRAENRVQLLHLPNSLDYDMDASLSLGVSSVSSSLQTVSSTLGVVGTLKTDLANAVNHALGDALVAVKKTYSGAVARTQHLVNQEIVSVTDFYDIQNENIVAGLNRAVTYVKSRPNGGSIFVPPGEYMPDGGQVDLGLAGYDKYLTIYSNKDAYIDLKNYTATPLFYVGAATATGNCNIVFDKLNVATTGTLGTGKFCRAENANGLKIQNCFIKNIAQVVDSSNSFAVHMLDNHFRSVSQYVFVSSTSCHGLIFRDNKVYDCGTAAGFGSILQISANTDNILVDGNKFEGLRKLATLSGGTAITFTNNYIEYFSVNTPIDSTNLIVGFVFDSNWLNGDDLANGRRTWIFPYTQGGSFSNNSLSNLIVTYQAGTRDITYNGNATYNTNVSRPATSLSLLNSHLGTVNFTKVDSIVSVYGNITTGLNAGTIGQLPVGYRPTENLVVNGFSIDTLGNIAVSGATVANRFINVIFLVS